MLKFVAATLGKEILQTFGEESNQRSSSGCPDTHECKQYNTSFIETGECTLVTPSLRELGCLFGFYHEIFLRHAGYCSSR